MSDCKKHKVLKIDDLFAGYGKKEVLFGVNMEVNQGEIVSIIGPNGSGKSTVLKSIIGINDIYSGIIEFYGNNILHLATHSIISSGIGYVLQSGNIFSDLTVKENLIIGFRNKKKNELLNNLKKIFHIFNDLERYKDMSAGLLSGGEKQMLAIGIILMNNPSFLIMDEPTAGLSPSNAHNLISNVKLLNQKYKITCLIVEQNIKDILPLSSRTYVLRNGQVYKHYNDPKSIQDKELREIFFK